MFEDFIKGIREYISDRFMSPLGASLAASWCAWNYKSLLIIFSGESAIRKIHLLQMVYQNAWYSWIHLAIGPLMTAAFYILVFPYPSNWVYSYSLKRRKEALNLKRQIDDQTALTQEESRALRNRFMELETQHMTESARLGNTIDSLKNQLKQLVEERDALAEELTTARHVEVTRTMQPEAPPSSSSSVDPDAVNVKPISLDKSQWQMLDALGRNGSNTSVTTLSGRLSLGDAAIWYIAGQLEDMGLALRGSITDQLSGEGYRVVSLTDVGLRLFMQSIQ
ncbi:hypothetical protein ACMGRF_08160 [Stenotrophomonas sp. EMP41]|uniref:hypothetical protein n=1 Tax=Stenotrophomonas sp. EMP41 TaxID=3396625 RepID=UPI0039C432E3